ncbi:hypothetical protein FGW37_22465 [Streptomyces rectiverticillatus]|uniref:hypothetical protein n=1 Tax=Streptomyces rectiverticillatus TaxID=173860 RepID=UPI0015C2CC9E|nr:hypothetical protein [Streptomyces rectiverticillatus]QLE73975.1 hypothetical protein FGW37_22465 [Streptomyces rectiverticillatus]
MTDAAHTTDPAAAYAGAPRILSEIVCVLRQAQSRRRFGTEQGREFWLRKAAVFDRIAIEEAATYAPDVAAPAVDAAANAARQLVEYDVTHTGLSLRGSDVVTDEDCRRYVRRQYREWSRTQLL